MAEGDRYINSLRKNLGLPSIFRELIREDANGKPYLAKTISGATGPYLELQFANFDFPPQDNLGNDIDPTSLTDWNNLFVFNHSESLPESVAFTGITVNGFTVRLTGGSNIVFAELSSATEPSGDCQLLKVIDTGTLKSMGGSSTCITLLSLNEFSSTSIENISDGCFADVASLVTVNIPNALTIGVNAFSHCLLLQEIDLPNCTTIGDYAFLSCTSLVTASSSCTVIGSGVFNGCTSLTDVTLPNALLIGPTSGAVSTVGVFYNCTSLVNVSIPSATRIGSGTFSNCTSLTSLTFNSCTSFYQSAFQGASALVSVTAPNLTLISGTQCFRSCTSLTTINYPLLTAIGNNCFQSCTSLSGTIYLDACTNLGTTTGNNSVFASVTGRTLTLRIKTATATDGDVVALQGSNTVTLVLT